MLSCYPVDILLIATPLPVLLTNVAISIKTHEHYMYHNNTSVHCNIYIICMIIDCTGSDLRNEEIHKQRAPIIRRFSWYISSKLCLNGLPFRWSCEDIYHEICGMIGAKT